jgi:hypothetical protein
MSVKVLKGSGSRDRAISERKTATSVVGKDGQRSWLRELRESARALGLRLRRRGSLYLLTFTGRIGSSGDPACADPAGCRCA